MTRCVVTLGVGQRFAAGVKRMGAGLKANGYEGTGRMLTAYPPGCPTHKEIPYGFKPWLIDRARYDGFDQVLWMDAACVPVKPLDGLFELLAVEGAVFPYSPLPIWQWCSDACRDAMGLSKARLRGLCPSMWACVIGLDFRHGAANEFLDQWLLYSRDGVSFHGAWTNENGQVSANPEVKGHRHDQTVASILAFEMGLPFHLEIVAYDMDNVVPLEAYEGKLTIPDCPAYILSNHLDVKTSEHSD